MQGNIWNASHAFHYTVGLALLYSLNPAWSTFPIFIMHAQDGEKICHGFFEQLGKFDASYPGGVKE